MKKSDKIMFYIYISLLIIGIYFVITRSIQRFKCPKMTETELMFNTFNYLLLDFKECK